MRTLLGLLVLLLAVGCMPSPYKNLPPECGDPRLQQMTGGMLGVGNAKACRASVDRQGGLMNFMKSPEEMQQELGGRRTQTQQRDMPAMTPEQYQQSQQLMQQMQPFMQQMSPMMQQMQGGPMPSGQRSSGQPNMMLPGSQQMPQGMPEMTPEQQEQMRRQMLQQQTPPPTQ